MFDVFRMVGRLDGLLLCLISCLGVTNSVYLFPLGFSLID